MTGFADQEKRWLIRILKRKKKKAGNENIYKVSAGSSKKNANKEFAEFTQTTKIGASK